MKIGLMGCEFFSANKGCEALTYSILSILNNIESIEKNSIIYNFSGTGLGDIADKFPKFKFIEVKPKIKDLSLKFIKAVKKCDIILDATMGDSFYDIYSLNYYNKLIRQKKIAVMLCKNYILLPQTYGPFKNKKSEVKAEKILKKSKKIYCRDEISKNILEKQFEIKDVELSSDMAFILPYKKEDYSFALSNKIKIGINVSGLLYKGGFNSANQFDLKMNYKEYIKSLLEYLSNNTEYEVYLIPHVIDLKENAYDDDYKVCKMLQSRFNNCILSPIFNTPIEAKSYISNMDIFIGSRMHSTIAAFSSKVITIPISYSRKFEGLFGSLNYEYVINGKEENNDTALNKTIEYIRNRDKLLNNQKEAQKKIEDNNKKFITSLENIIKKIKNG